MLNYLIRRVLLGLLTLLLVTCLIYALMRSMPGSPLTMNLESMDKDVTPKQLEELRKLYGIDKPWYVAYFIWIGGMLQGDFGHSIVNHQPVMTVIGGRIGPTLLLSISSMFLTYVFSVPMGLYASVRYGKTDERVMSTVLYMLYSLPSFVTALLLQAWLSYRWGWFPLLGMYDSRALPDLSFVGKVFHVAWHCVLPVACYTYASWAYYSRFIRANMAEALQQDYIRTARAKGVGPMQVVVKHAFRNTMIPMATLVGLSLPALLSGSIILEKIFSWPGMGQLFLDAITTYDYNLIMGLTFVFSVLTLLGTLLADVLYAVVDPRVTYS